MGGWFICGAPATPRALSHRPFLLLTTCLAARLGFNKFNGLASRRNAAREPLLARSDNAAGGTRAPSPMGGGGAKQLGLRASTPWGARSWDGSAGRGGQRLSGGAGGRRSWLRRSLGGSGGTLGEEEKEVVVECVS